MLAHQAASDHPSLVVSRRGEKRKDRAKEKRASQRFSLLPEQRQHGRWRLRPPPPSSPAGPAAQATASGDCCAFELCQGPHLPATTRVSTRAPASTDTCPSPSESRAVAAACPHGDSDGAPRPPPKLAGIHGTATAWPALISVLHQRPLSCRDPSTSVAADVSALHVGEHEQHRRRQPRVGSDGNFWRRDTSQGEHHTRAPTRHPTHGSTVNVAETDQAPPDHNHTTASQSRHVSK